LYESYHPDVLRNALERDRLFDQLWIQVEHFPYLRHAAAAELEDMQRGDVPLFTARPALSYLWSSSASPIDRIVQETGLAMVHKRIRSFGAPDLARQRWFIDASFATTPDPSTRVRLRQSADDSLTTDPAERDLLLTAARTVGDQLERMAIRGKDDATWTGLAFTNEHHASIVPLGMDLYDGLPGVALFLAYLGALTGEVRYTRLAQAALAGVLHKLERDQSGSLPAMTSIGAFQGYGGLIYTLAHLSALWREPELAARAEALVSILPALVDRDEQLDIIGGAAGCIAALLALYRTVPSSSTLDAAVRCGSWLLPGGAKRATLLTGFSHGAAGMASVLLDLAAVAHEERFRSAALELIAWERGHFHADRGNWSDLRHRQPADVSTTGSELSFQVSWCHGAPGIGLARLRSLQYLDDSEIRAEIDVALNTTLAAGFSRNDSLCHGNLGNLELVLYASQLFKDAWLKSEVSRIGGIILRRTQQHGLLCGVSSGVETPGLMTGIAGIGYGFLRLAEPAQAPSLLALASPQIAP
jgi:type 2 lantibiotic biosynthesis protein LanM